MSSETEETVAARRVILIAFEIFEDLNDTSLDGPKVNEDNKFIEWEPPFNVDMSLIRYMYGKRFKNYWDGMFTDIAVPSDIDELNYTPVEMAEMQAEILEHPGYKFEDYYNPKTQTT